MGDENRRQCVNLAEAGPNYELRLRLLTELHRAVTYFKTRKTYKGFFATNVFNSQKMNNKPSVSTANSRSNAQLVNVTPEQYRNQLIKQYANEISGLKRTSVGLIGFIGVLGSIGTFLGLVLMIWPSALLSTKSFFGVSGVAVVGPNDSKDTFLILLTFTALVWSIYRTVSTPTRASEEVYFSHEAIHTLRDYILADHSLVENEKLAVMSVLQSAEKAFTLVTKRKCSATIKTVINNSSVIVSHTSDSSNYRVSTNLDGEDISNYASIVHITRNDRRFYICNDIWLQFRNGNYFHPDLKNTEQRGIFQPLVRSLIEYFSPPTEPLNFRSTLVLPIRYIDKNFSGNVSVHSPYVYLGFLCIDSKSRRSFKSRVITEIGALYADALCAIFLATRLNGSIENGDGR